MTHLNSNTEYFIEYLEREEKQENVIVLCVMKISNRLVEPDKAWDLLEASFHIAIQSFLHLTLPAEFRVILILHISRVSQDETSGSGTLLTFFFPTKIILLEDTIWHVGIVVDWSLCHLSFHTFFADCYWQFTLSILMFVENTVLNYFKA